MVKNLSLKEVNTAFQHYFLVPILFTLRKNLKKHQQPLSLKSEVSKISQFAVFLLKFLLKRERNYEGERDTKERERHIGRKRESVFMSACKREKEREEGRKNESVLTKGGQNHLRNVIENNELIGSVNSPQHLQANQSKRMEFLPNKKFFFWEQTKLIYIYW